MEFYIGQPDFWIEETMPNLSASGSLTEDLLLTQKKRYLEAWLIGKSIKGNTFSFLIYNKTMNLYDVNSGYMPTYNSMMIMPTMIMPPLMPNDVNEAIVYATAAGIGHEMTHGFDSFGARYDTRTVKRMLSSSDRLIWTNSNKYPSNWPIATAR